MRLTLDGLQRHPVLLAGPAYPETLARLKPFFDVEVVDVADIADPITLGTRLAGKSALIATQMACVDSAMLSIHPHLKAICKIGPIHADIDLEACRRAGIMATGTPDLGDGELAQRQMALVAAENLIAAFGF